MHTTIIIKKLHSKSSRLSENIRKRRGEKVDILKMNEKKQDVMTKLKNKQSQHFL